MSINWSWLSHQLCNPFVNKIATPLKVREIGSSNYKTNEYMAFFCICLDGLLMKCLNTLVSVENFTFLMVSRLIYWLELILLVRKLSSSISEKRQFTFHLYHQLRNRHKATRGFHSSQASTTTKCSCPTSLSGLYIFHVSRFASW